ncbi:MAG: DMT family transporter [Bacteroidota bacterium]
MLYLLLAIMFTTTIMLLFKLFDRYKVDNLVAITVNYAVAACFGFFLSPVRMSPATIIGQPWFWVALAAGASLIITFLIYALSTQKVGIAISAVTGKMSAVIPVMIGILMFRESMNALKIIGVILALVAFWLTFKKEKAGKIEWKYLFLPFLLFVGNGANDSLFKIAQAWYIPNENITFFLACTFGISLLMGLLVLVIRIIIKKKWPDIKSIIAGILLGLANWGATYFFFLGLTNFDISVFVPVFNVSIVILSALSGLLLFREKLRLINWIGIASAVAAILLIAFS